MEQSDDGTLEFGTTASINGCRTECLPYDSLANVGGNKQRDTRTKTVALLQQLVQQENDQTGNEELFE